jgi:hypothetical protein
MPMIRRGTLVLAAVFELAVPIAMPALMSAIATASTDPAAVTIRLRAGVPARRTTVR